MKSLPPYDECPTPIHTTVMNIIVWNCRGTLKPSFQNHVRNLVNNHELVILIVMVTRIGRDRAREITNRLPFDGDIHADTIGYTGGLWMLWNSLIRWRSPLSPTQSKKSMSPSWYEVLTLLGFSLPFMLALEVLKDTFYGTIFLKLQTCIICCGS